MHARWPFNLTRWPFGCSLQRRWSYVLWNSEAGGLETRSRENCCLFALYDPSHLPTGPMATEVFDMPSTAFGLEPRMYMQQSLPRVVVFAVDLHAGATFNAFYQWQHTLPYHFRFKYYTNTRCNTIAGTLVPDPQDSHIIVDGHSLEEARVLPWAGDKSVNNFRAHFAEEIHTADILYCHDPPHFCSLLLPFQKPIISLIGTRVSLESIFVP